MSSRSEAGPDPAGEIALAFLQDFWRGDVAAATRRCAPGAIFVFARSLPYPRECPIGEALGSIVDVLFSQFDPPGTFRVDVRHVVSTAGTSRSSIPPVAGCRTGASTRTTTLWPSPSRMAP